MPLTVHEATDAEVTAILRWTHDLWGGGRAFEDYEARWKGLLAHPWARDNFRFMLAVEEGTPVSACKLYRFEMMLQGKVVSAIGFGAVFTPEGLRGRGYAAVMLQTLMEEEATRGTHLALLYSDIGTAYYERLGFVSLGEQSAEASATPGFSPFRPMSEPERTRIPQWQAPSPLSHLRSDDYWNYLLTRESPELWVFAPDGVAKGFAAIEAENDQLFIVAAGHKPGHEAAFWTGLRHEAHQRGLSCVAGWLPPLTIDYGYARRPQPEAIPMAKSLQGDPIPTPAALWALDHF